MGQPSILCQRPDFSGGKELSKISEVCLIFIHVNLSRYWLSSVFSLSNKSQKPLGYHERYMTCRNLDKERWAETGSGLENLSITCSSTEFSTHNGRETLFQYIHNYIIIIERWITTWVYFHIVLSKEVIDYKLLKSKDLILYVHIFIYPVINGMLFPPIYQQNADLLLRGFLRIKWDHEKIKIYWILTMY